MEEFREFRNIRAILFDFDNTLVDFESNSLKALQEVAKEIHDYIVDNGFSVSISYDDIYNTLLSISSKFDSEGIYDRTIWFNTLLEKIHVSASKDQVLEWVSLYWSIASIAKPFSEVQDTLEFLKKKGYKLGVVTNSDGEGGNKQKRMERYEFTKLFDVVVIGGENNIKPKPSVQPFVYACERLGFQPSQCAMVGDDPVKDCLAAKKAGMMAILVDRHGRVKFAELYADFVINDLEELQEVF